MTDPRRCPTCGGHFPTPHPGIRTEGALRYLRAPVGVLVGVGVLLVAAGVGVLLWLA